MPISLLQPLSHIPIAVVDVETTGAAAELGDRIVEIGIVRLLHGQPVRMYQQLIDPQRRIGAGASAITGITQAMVTGQPTFAQIAPQVQQLLAGSVVVGHNVAFDLSFIHREFQRLGIDLSAAFGTTHVLDTVRIARRRFGRGGNGLARLSARLGVVAECFHRALADAYTTGMVLDRLLEPVGGWKVTLLDALSQQGGPVNFTPAPRARSLPLELDEALELRLPVLMVYLDARDQRTQRVIEPIHVKKLGGELLLVAHCQLRQAQRTFKVERIVSVTRVDTATADYEPTPVPIPPSKLFE